MWKIWGFAVRQEEGDADAAWWELHFPSDSRFPGGSCQSSDRNMTVCPTAGDSACLEMGTAERGETLLLSLQSLFAVRGPTGGSEALSEHPSGINGMELGLP